MRALDLCLLIRLQRVQPVQRLGPSDSASRVAIGSERLYPAADPSFSFFAVAIEHPLGGHQQIEFVINHQACSE